MADGQYFTQISISIEESTSVTSTETQDSCCTSIPKVVLGQLALAYDEPAVVICSENTAG